MKNKVLAGLLTVAMVATMVTGCGSSSEDTSESKEETKTEDTTYKVGIVQYVDDASLNQIEKAIEAELDAKGE